MSLTRTVVSLLGAGSMLLAAPAFASEGVASRLSLSNASPATPSVSKDRQFFGKNGVIFAFLGLLTIGTIVAIATHDDNDNNGAPASP